MCRQKELVSDCKTGSLGWQVRYGRSWGIVGPIHATVEFIPLCVIDLNALSHKNAWVHTSMVWLNFAII